MKPFLYLIFLMLVCATCKKNDVPQIDPCLGAKPFTANFIISENPEDSVGTDTVLIYSYITFTAPNKYQVFEWKIGTDPRTFSGNNLNLLFDDVNTQPGELINVQFIGKQFYDPCLPARNGKNDTVSRNFRIIAWKHSPIIGRFEGFFESDKSKKEIIEVRYIDTVPAASCSGKFGCFRLFNIDRGCNTVLTNPGIYPLNVTIDVGKGARILVFDEFSSGRNFSNNCRAPKGDIQLSPTNRDSVKVIFTYSESMSNSSKRLNDRFIGVRKL